MSKCRSNNNHNEQKSTDFSIFALTSLQNSTSSPKVGNNSNNNNNNSTQSIPSSPSSRIPPPTNRSSSVHSTESDEHILHNQNGNDLSYNKSPTERYDRPPSLNNSNNNNNENNH
uniref:Uncharacterized protein n=1 Tax=Trichobilharzia regenti TaxID=157069 RepID=A0AA85IRZ1_TRIRE|nr:unnamed protein product [Trichobilharzia regenti]